MTQRDTALKKRQVLINKGVEHKGIKIHNECIFINHKFHYRVSENISAIANLQFCNSATHDIYSESMEPSSSSWLPDPP